VNRHYPRRQQILSDIHPNIAKMEKKQFELSIRKESVSELMSKALLIACISP
jgi:hypothetical protein